MPRKRLIKSYGAPGVPSNQGSGAVGGAGKPEKNNPDAQNNIPPLSPGQPENQPAPSKIVRPMGQTAPTRNTKPEVLAWLKKYSSAKKFRDWIASRYRWKDFIDEFKGHFRIANGSADIQINALNYIFAYIKTEIPALYLKNPYIKVNAKKGSSIQSARILEEAINYDWRHKRLKKENKKNIFDGKLIGHSWFKSGYTGKFGTVEDGNGNTLEYIEAEDFFGYRVPWDCVVFDLDSIDPPHDCGWIAHDVWVNLDDVRKNPRYKNTDKLTAQSRKPTNYSNSTTSADNAQYKDDEKKACLIEVWDMKNQQVFTISEGVDDYIEDPKSWPYEMRGYPFSYLCFNPVNDEPYGMSDVYMFENQVLELTKIRAMELDHLKRGNRQFGYNGSLTQEQKESIAMGVTGNVVENIDVDKFKALPYAAFQSDGYMIEKFVKEDMINISGQSPQERGATQQTSTRTFRELAQIAKGAENRRAEQIDVVEDFITDIANKRIALMQQFADVPYYVRITGKDPQEIMQALSSRPSASAPGAVTNEQGFTFTKEDIQGEYDIEVIPGSTAPMDKNTIVSMILDTLQYLPQLGVQPGGPVMGAIGTIIADFFQLPELKEAMAQEAQAAAQMREQQAQQAQDAQHMAIAQEAAKSQLDAEKVATKQNDTLVKVLQMAQPQKLSEVK